MNTQHQVYWTIRRELWENRSIYIAPAVVALLEVVSLLLHAFRHPEEIALITTLDGSKQQLAFGAGYGGLAVPILATALIVSVFYSLDTLYSERRDRSILFWKSLPVSDTATVLGKALIPLVVLPVITLAVICATQIVMLLAATLILSINGLSLSLLWSGVPLVTVSLTLVYGMAAMALWYAPLYGWLFLVSAFARRMTILWALLPPLAICFAETLAFHTDYGRQILTNRFDGFVMAAFDVQDAHHFTFSLDKLDPMGLLSAPGLWIGLVVAALFFGAAIQLRRYRGPA